MLCDIEIDTDAPTQLSGSQIILNAVFDSTIPVLIDGDITVDEGSIAPINEEVILTVEKSLTDFNTLMPNAALSVAQDDEFVFINAAMPDEYVIDAEQRLGQALQDYIDKNDYEKYDYNIKIDNKIVGLDEDILAELYLGYSIKLKELEEPLSITNISITHRDSSLFDEYEVKISPTTKKITGIS